VRALLVLWWFIDTAPWAGDQVVGGCTRGVEVGQDLDRAPVRYAVVAVHERYQKPSEPAMCTDRRITVRVSAVPVETGRLEPLAIGDLAVRRGLCC
jgi:hypothetical protein